MDAEQKISVAKAALDEAVPGTDQYEEAVVLLNDALWELKKEAALAKGIVLE